MEKILKENVAKKCETDLKERTVYDCNKDALPIYHFICGYCAAIDKIKVSLYTLYE